MDKEWEPIEEENYKLAIRACRDIQTKSNTPHIDIAMSVAIDVLERQIPKQVLIQDWSPAVCPTCGVWLSEHHGDGYFTHADWLERCPNEDCCQRLKW